MWSLAQRYVSCLPGAEEKQGVDTLVSPDVLFTSADSPFPLQPLPLQPLPPPSPRKYCSIRQTTSKCIFFHSVHVFKIPFPPNVHLSSVVLGRLLQIILYFFPFCPSFLNILFPPDVHLSTVVLGRLLKNVLSPILSISSKYIISS